MADQEVVKLGSRNESVLYLQKEGKHVSIGAWNQINRILKVRKYRDFRDFIPAEIEGHLRQAGFYEAALAGSLKLDKVLISAMVERWRPETHTFHMPFGECTITLQDVAVHLGLPIDGNPVIGVIWCDWSELVEDLLGVVPPASAIKGGGLKLVWLAAQFNFHNLAGADPIQITYAARAYILRLIEIGCCAYLIQVWAWLRIPGIDPDPPRLHRGLPLAARWRDPDPEKPIKWAKKQIEWWRTKLDDLSSNDLWKSYSDRVLNGLPERCRENMHLWRTVVSMVLYHVSEWHQPDRVMQQFGMFQHIPNAPSQLNEMHDISLKGNEKQDWVHNMRGFIQLWSERHQRLANQPETNTLVGPNDEYMIWYDKYSVRWLTRAAATRGQMAMRVHHVWYGLTPEGRPLYTDHDLQNQAARCLTLCHASDRISHPTASVPSFPMEFTHATTNDIPPTGKEEGEGLGRRRESQIPEDVIIQGGTLPPPHDSTHCTPLI
ncbi:serine/threonine-protein phosphatase 7 long form homolog [Lotus japonicus]|uniref:serine/threonine-protein phosphatase 7 long form homolog n=1 Tax=Lotus japonicus TaxID=34305 RepID=UPI002587C6B0|nr:serine/threonine-protein phosphatase 7 long form homolog [Lotus japonicus]